jgi:hypothetical protein
MSLEQMTYGAGATMEFNAGFERAQDETKDELEKLRTELLVARHQCEKTRGELEELKLQRLSELHDLKVAQEKLLQLQSSSIVKYVADIQPAINALAGLLRPSIEKQIKEVMHGLPAMNRELVIGWIKDEFEEREIRQSFNDIDQEIQELKTKLEDIDIEDEIESYMDDNLEDKVKEAVQELSFSVRVE